MEEEKELTVETAPVAAAPAPKKKGKQWLLWLVIIILAIGGGVWYLFFNYIPKFSVDGMEFSMKSKAKDIIKAGLVICDKNGKELDMDARIMPKTLDTTLYYICKKGGEKTGFVVELYNIETNARARKECSLYMVYYYPDSTKSGMKILINGQDFTKLSRETAKQLTTDAKMGFSSGKLDKFAKGEENIVSNSSSAYFWCVQESQGTIHMEFKKNNLKVKSK